MNRLTIIVDDNAVYYDKTGYTDLDLSSCQIPANIWALQWENGEGWLEFRTDEENERIEQIPEWANACVEKFHEADYLIKNPPPPTEEEIIGYNKAYITGILSSTDWTMLPDVNLTNKDEWIAYRAALREMINDPPSVTEFDLPTKPEEIWA